MAVVATSSYSSMTQMKMMLMDLPRIQLPRLSAFDVDGRRKELSPNPGSDAPAPRVKRRRTLGEAKTPTSRNRKKVFSYETEKDMETYKGHVRLPSDAIVLFEACRLGLLPRVQRRLSEKERQLIKSGSVFVWDEREAGMRRWTDGKSWSASRVSGSFLTYREMEGKRGGGQSNVFPPPPPSVSGRTNGGRTPENGAGSTSDMDLQQDEGPDGYRYKPDGLMKQSFSITTSSNNHLHLISYYSRSNAATQQLLTPTSDPALRHIRPAKGMYPESTVHEHQNIPPVTRSPMASDAPYSTVPQMAGYARHGPPNWSSQSNGHGWQQQPQHHMPPRYPQQGYGYQYPPQNGGYYQDGPPPPTNAQSPLQYSQSASHPAQHSPAPQTPYDDRKLPPTPQSSHAVDPNVATYDNKRQPLTPEDRQAPPPLQHPQDHVYGYGSLENPSREAPPREAYNAAPQYDSRRYPPQSNTPQDRRPPSSQHSQPSTPNRSGYPPQHQQQYYNYPPQGPPSHYGQQQHSPPQNAQHPQYSHRPQPTPPHRYQQPPTQHNYAPQAPPPQPPSSSQRSSFPGPPPPNLQIDPALTSRPSPHPQPQSYSNVHSQSSTPNPQKNDSTGNATPYEARGTSQASTIPSIGALMNGSSIDQNGHSPSTNSNSNGHSNGNGTGNTSGSGVATPLGTDKTGDKSPNPVKTEGPQDIGADKIGFSEDSRALNVLNKGFR